MSNEEAINLINMLDIKESGEIEVHSWWGSFKKDMEEAISLASKALKNEQKLTHHTKTNL